MKTKIVWFLALLFFVPAIAGRAQVSMTGIFITPANPTPDDSVTVSAVFVFPNSCYWASEGISWQYPHFWGDTLCDNAVCKFYLLEANLVHVQYAFCAQMVWEDTVSFPLGLLKSGEYWIDLVVTSYDLLWPPELTRHDTLFSFSITPTSASEEPLDQPVKFQLSQNYPNPFNPSTTIEYSVEKKGQIDLLIYNTLGQKVRTLVSDVKESGTYSVRWDGKNDQGEKLPNGVYFYVLKTADVTSTRKMILLK